MISPRDSKTLHSDNEISSDESIHQSDIYFIDYSDVESIDESTDESSDEISD